MPYQIEDFTYVKRQVAEGKWRQGLCNGLPVFRAERNSAFVEDFVSQGDNFCPRFKVLGVASGSCAINCRGCYLQGTYRKMRIPGEPVLYDNLHACASELHRELRASFNTIFSDGEHCDSLLYDGPDFPVTETLLPVFVEHKRNRNRWLRLTKAANVDHLLNLDHQGVMTLSYSLNPQEISTLFEANQAATIAQRLAAARRGQDAGYHTRVRIDPVIAVDGWEHMYLAFLDQMKQCDLSPEVITLGTYRVIERSRPSFKMLGVVPPVELAYLLPTGVSSQQRRLRYPDSVRKHIYQYLIARIREKFPGTAIGLCKETNAMRAELGYTLAIR